MEQDLEPRPLHSPAELPRPGPNIPGGHVMHPAEVAAPQDGAQQPGCPAATPVTDLAQACLVAEDIPSQPEEFSHAVLDGESPDCLQYSCSKCMDKSEQKQQLRKSGSKEVLVVRLVVCLMLSQTASSRAFKLALLHIYSRKAE